MKPYLLLFILGCVACTHSDRSCRESVFFESPCVRATYEDGDSRSVKGAQLRYGPKEWSAGNPSGLYVGDSDVCDEDLLVISHALQDEKGKNIQAYTLLRLSQPELLAHTRVKVVSPMQFHRGVLEPDFYTDEKMREYSDMRLGVLKMGKQRPDVLVDERVYPYTRVELRPRTRPASRLFGDGYYQHRREGAGEFDGLILVKLTINADCRSYQLVRVEQGTPEAVPSLTVLSGLVLNDDALVDSSGHVHYSVRRVEGVYLLEDAAGCSFDALEWSCVACERPVRSPFAP